MDLRTSDPEASRAFYTGRFGWEARVPSGESGGCFMSTRGGIPIAGAVPTVGMADPTEASGRDSWSRYPDTDGFRSSTVRGPGADEQVAGVTDASSFLSEDEPSRWSAHREVEDTGAALARAVGLGAPVVDGATDTPYGRTATVRDPTGARFRLRRRPG